MRRGVLVGWHALSSILVGGLYFFFVLPRWPELGGGLPHTWGTVLRILTGALLALTTVPVLIDLRKARPPEFGTPQLALGLRLWSIIGYLVAAAGIVVTAIVEIWVPVGVAGRVLFGVYGASAAIAVLGAAAFYLAFAAESQTAPPKPLKPKKATPEPERDSEAESGEQTGDALAEAAEAAEAVEDTEAVEDDSAETGDDAEASGDSRTADEPETALDGDGPGDDQPRRRLRNRRPSRTR